MRCAVPFLILSPLRDVVVKNTKKFSEKDSNYLAKVLESADRYGFDEEDTLDIDLNRVSSELVKHLVNIADKSRGIKGKRRLLQQINSYIELRESGVAKAKITALKALESAMIEYIMASEHQWIYKKHATGHFLPAVVTDVTYSPASYSRGMTIPERVTIDYEYQFLGDSRDSKLEFFISDLRGGGATCSELLQQKNIFLENEKQNKLYLDAVGRFQKLKKQIGLQVAGEGMGIESEGRYYASKLESLEYDGRQIKFVIDTHDGYDKYREVRSDLLAADRKSRVKAGETDIDEDDVNVTPPIWPFLHTFSLQSHKYLYIHAADLTEYKYDTSLRDKLVLPSTHKNLVEVLVQSAGDLMDDIIIGKTGGIIIIATGVPGTGKTLTAEVYSEVIERPLYVVQASQLGININDLEKHLTEVLERAIRWGAILLIDECDVYVRSRGEDIQQNAIVGVFLRVLEYYRGVLFLTSNREVMIDDAIMSRSTAHIKYMAPGKEAQKAIFDILIEQFELKVSKTLVSEVLEDERYSTMVGRDIKSLLKLSGLLAKRDNKPITKELFDFAAQFKLDSIERSN